MTLRTFTTGLLATMMAAVVGVGGVLAHGDDIEEMAPGYGMDYRMESGDMTGHGPGRGMMGGYGMGPGMMGDYGMGPGMMGGITAHGLDLDSEQRKQMARIGTELRKELWTLQGRIIDAQGRLSTLFSEEPLDAKKIGAAYGQIFDVRRQMIEAAIDARNRRRAVLTEAQRERLLDGYYEDHHGPRHGDRDRSHRRMGG